MICVGLTDSMFAARYHQIRTQVKFASDFHRDKKADKGQEFHVKDKQQEIEDAKGLKEGHFAPIKKRLRKIETKMKEVENFQY